MTRIFGCKIIALIILVFCTGHPQMVVAGDISYEKMIQIAGLKEFDAARGLMEYKRQKNNKFFLVDPFNKNAWSYHYSFPTKRSALSKAQNYLHMVTFAVNDKLVWQAELEKYLNSPIGKGRAFYENNNYKNALPHFQKAAQIHPDNWYVHNRLGWTYARVGDFQQSVDSFRKSLGIKTSLHSRMGLIQALLYQNNFKAAEVEYKKLPSAIPGYLEWDYKFIKVGYYAALGNHDKAARVFGKQPVWGLTLSEDDNGIIVLGVLPRSPVYYAGLEPGDVITRLNNADVKGLSKKQFVDLVNQTPYATTIELEFLRADQLFKSQMINGFTADLPQLVAGLKTMVKQ